MGGPIFGLHRSQSSWPCGTQPMVNGLYYVFPFMDIFNFAQVSIYMIGAWRGYRLSPAGGHDGYDLLHQPVGV
jgi:hypothetical protein